MRIAFAGNPNSGKTTMYNALTGRNEKVGNWAGVTVDKKEAPIKRSFAGDMELIAVDLPGAYSMSPFTSEESITSGYVMIIRKDGKSNVYFGDCFDELITAELKGVPDKEFDEFYAKHKDVFKGKKKDEIRKKYKGKNINIGLITPPYSQDDVVELEFVEHLLDILATDGTGVVVVPMSCAIGTKFKEVRRRLFEKHTLDAVFSMPEDIFYPTGTNVCVMVWKAHRPHNKWRETFFGYCKNDGFVKRKKLGRVDAFGRWKTIEAQWLSLYQNRDVEDGLSARQCVSAEDEWLCEAYIKTDYNRLTDYEFQTTVNKHLAHLVCHQITDLTPRFICKDPSVTLNTYTWKEFSVESLFDVKYGINLELINRDCRRDWNESSTVHFVARTENDNGVVAYVDVIPGKLQAYSQPLPMETDRIHVGNVFCLLHLVS